MALAVLIISEDFDQYYHRPSTQSLYKRLFRKKRVWIYLQMGDSFPIFVQPCQMKESGLLLFTAHDGRFFWCWCVESYEPPSEGHN